MKSLFAALVIALLAAAPEPTAEPVDLLITGATVVTMDSLWNVYEDGYVAIRNGRIVGVGELSGFDQSRYRPGDVVDAGGNAILPGLINTHTHAPMADAIRYARPVRESLQSED